MEMSAKDSVCSIYNDEDFANHITINLFKKKNNIRVSRINTSKRETRSQTNSSASSYKTRHSIHRPKNNESSQLSRQKCVSSSTSSQNIINLEVHSVPSSKDQKENSSNISNISIISDKNDDQFSTMNSSDKITLEDTNEQPIYPSKIGNFSTDKVQSSETLTSASISGSDDLTPLSWLQSLDMGGVVPHLAAPPTPPASPLPNQNLSAEGTYEPPRPPVPEKIDYSVDGSVKPPYSYAALIGMAMKENNNKMTLSAIYKWIKEHFVFYKTADQSWQNSIRHNLSLNKCFIKVARSKDEPGKGGFWKLDPEYAESLIDGVFKKRRPSKSTAPPATKCKRKKLFPYSQQAQIQKQVEKQKQKEMEELLRQKEQDEAVQSLLQPIQASYMPPPTDKPPSISAMYIHQDISDQNHTSILVDEGGNPLKEDFVWSSILGDDANQEECWQLGPQEVVTDITQSGDPSTYQVTMSPASSVTSLSSSTSSVLNNFVQQNSCEIIHPLITCSSNKQNVHTLPSFDLSPESLGVDEDLFGSPNYSDTSNDCKESLLPTFDLGVGLDLAVSTSWENKTNISSKGDYDDILCEEYARTLEINENDDILMNMEGSPQELIELHDLEGNLSTHLTTLEPAAPVVVQQVNSSECCWTQEQKWEEAKSLSFLEANLDFDKLIDLDVI